MNKTLGEYGTFWFYMSWCVVGVFFVYFFLPETKGKSFEEIEKDSNLKRLQEVTRSQIRTVQGILAEHYVSNSAVLSLEKFFVQFSVTVLTLYYL